ncbi:MAG: hypothetical protein DRH21_08200 [Deltaproteobacteria bacterium]|nr:MAG: hypothetical protein DRH21_08200 [Deltaproteobacteria bacterium]
MIGDIFLMIFTFLNVDLVKIEEAGRIEDENKEYRNIKNNLNGQGQQWFCFCYCCCLYITAIKRKYQSLKIRVILFSQ